MSKTDYDIIPLDLDDLAITMGKNVKEDIKDFTDLINLDGAIKREIYINGIDDGTGQSVEGYIRFWNAYDEIRKYLREKGFVEQVVSTCIEKLKGYHYIDDSVFAKELVRSYPSLGENGLKRKLVEKGISQKIIEDCFVNSDEEQEIQKANCAAEKFVKSRSNAKNL